MGRTGSTRFIVVRSSSAPIVFFKSSSVVVSGWKVDTNPGLRGIVLRTELRSVLRAEDDSVMEVGGSVADHARTLGLPVPRNTSIESCPRGPNPPVAPPPSVDPPLALPPLAASALGGGNRLLNSAAAPNVLRGAAPGRPVPPGTSPSTNPWLFMLRSASVVANVFIPLGVRIVVGPVLVAVAFSAPVAASWSVVAFHSPVFGEGRGRRRRLTLGSSGGGPSQIASLLNVPCVRV